MKRKYEALFIASERSVFSFSEDGWDVQVEEFLPEGEVTSFVEGALELTEVNSFCGIKKYIGKESDIEVSVFYSERHEEKIESLYIKCYSSKEVIKVKYQNSALAAASKLFDPKDTD